MLILGVDPGTVRCGFGIIEKAAQGRLNHVTHGTIVLDAHKTMNERLSDLAHDLTTLVTQYQPSYGVVEDVFVFKNPRSALVLGQARGVALAVLGLRHISAQSLTPTAVKALVTGRGRAQKFQVAHMVALELNIEVPQSPDAADALALALAYGRSALFLS